MLGEWQIACALLDLEVIDRIAFKDGNRFVEVRHGRKWSSKRPADLISALIKFKFNTWHFRQPLKSRNQNLVSFLTKAGQAISAFLWALLYES